MLGLLAGLPKRNVSVPPKCDDNISSPSVKTLYLSASSFSSSSMNESSSSKTLISSIPHYSSSQTEQISLVIKGAIDVSGPKLDFVEFLWRVCCVLAYESTRFKSVSRSTQYLVASILYGELRSSSYLGAFSSPESGPTCELLCPIEVKGFTEFPIESPTFPQIRKSINRVFRYQVKSGAVLRVRAGLTIQACKFNDKYREMARIRGYIPLLPPSDEGLISYFSLLENSIETAGAYNEKDISSFIASGIDALAEKEANPAPSFIQLIKEKVFRQTPPALLGRPRSTQSSKPPDGLKMLTNSKLKGDTYDLTLCESSSSLKKHESVQ